MKLIISFLFIFSVSAKVGLRSTLSSHLPFKVQKIELGQSKDVVIKALGQPGKEGKSSLHYQTLFKKYDTTIGLKNNKVSYIYFHVKPGTLRFKDLEAYVSLEQLDMAKEKVETKGHSQSETLNVSLPKKGVTILFQNNKLLTVKGFILGEIK